MLLNGYKKLLGAQFKSKAMLKGGGMSEGTTPGMEEVELCREQQSRTQLPRMCPE